MKTYDDILRDLHAGNYAPMYFLYGEEPYYIDKVADYIEENALDAMAREFDQTILYGKDYERDMRPIISAARGFAMMGGKRVIIVKEAQNIRSWEPLNLYLNQVAPDTILVFCYKYGKPDKRLSLWKNFEKAGGVMMESAKLRDYQVQQWILNYIRDYNTQKGAEVKIDERVVALLAESLGNDLQTIVNQLQKVIDGRPEGVNTIDAALVERNIGISKDFNIFELEDALIAGDVVKANRITQYFAQSKDHAIQRELIILFGFFANLLIYHYLPDKNERAAAQALGVNPFFVKTYAAASRRFSAGKTFHIIGYMRDIDARSKGIDNPSATEADLWKELIFKILH